MLNRTALVAQEAKDMAVQNRRDHENHVAVCLDNQRRIETRFAGIDAKLDKQNDESRLFRDTLQVRMDLIRENDSRRYTAMMGLAVTSLLGIVIMIAQVVAAHFWK